MKRKAMEGDRYRWRSLGIYRLEVKGVLPSGSMALEQGKVDHNGLFPLLDSDSDPDTDSCTMQILWKRDPDLNLSQLKHVLHNAM